MPNQCIYPVILAGGNGERLWPLSRKDHPKQLLSLIHPTSLLRDTALRVQESKSYFAPTIICGYDHQFLVAEHLKDINLLHIFAEPCRRNTAPAIAIAALHISNIDEHAVIAVLPSDHAIADTNTFHHSIQRAAALALDNYIVMLGIHPDHADTGYGYIQKGSPLNVDFKAFEVATFAEKPDIETATQYVQSEQYVWNSGMFVMKVSTYLHEMERLEPDMLELCKQALSKSKHDLYATKLNHEDFEAIEGNSIDYAIAERTQRAAVIPVNMGWNDLGAWDSVYATHTKDRHQNVIKGDVVSVHNEGCYFESPSDRLLACMGLDNIAVINTHDATLVMPLDQAQNIKQLTQHLIDHKRDEMLHHTTVLRPWGSYTHLVSGSGFQVKRIHVKQGGRLSLQSHYHRSEHWIVVSGTAEVTRGDHVFLLHEGESTFISASQKHRLANPGKIDLELIEVQCGSYLEEDDITRYDDVYGRAEK